MTKYRLGYDEYLEMYYVEYKWWFWWYGISKNELTTKYATFKTPYSAYKRIADIEMAEYKSLKEEAKLKKANRRVVIGGELQYDPKTNKFIRPKKK